jgi:DNA-binding CsgD family transcriptional regulator
VIGTLDRRDSQDLVERDREIHALAHAVEQACAGQGGAIAVLGSAGAGKTSLLGHAARLPGPTVLSATASELEQEFPFGVVRQLFERQVHTGAAVPGAGPLSGAARLAAPALGLDEDPVLVRPTFSTFHGLYWVVANLSADGPLLLVVDDAQWADDASLQFLTYFVRRVVDLPVLVLIAGRTGDPAADRPAVLELFAEAALTTLAPAPLSRGAVRGILENAIRQPPQAALVDLFYENTAGNPFLVRELALHVGREETEADGADGVGAPESISRSISLRLRRLGPHVRALAEATVILGDGCAVDEAAELAGISFEDAAGAAAQMMRAEILRPAERLSFVHPLVRTAVDEGLTPAERTARHGRAAVLLMSRGAARDRVAAQLLKSSPSLNRQAAQLLREAGEEAMAMGAPATAALFLARAIPEDPGHDAGGELHYELGLALALSGDARSAVPVLRRSYAGSRDPMELARRCRTLWLALVNTSAVDAGFELLRSTIARIGDENREARLLVEAEFFTAGFLDARRLHDAWAVLTPAEALAGDSPAERRLLAIHATRLLYRPGVAAASVAEVALRAMGTGTLVRENLIDASQWVWSITSFLLTDQLDAAEAGLTVALEAAHATGSVQTLAIVHELRAWLRLRQGRLAEAEADALDALARLAELPPTPPRNLIRIASTRVAVRVLLARGRIDEADQLIRAHGFDGDLPAELRQTRLRFERCLVRLAQGRTDEGLADALAIAAFNADHGLEDVADAPWRTAAATAYAMRGETPRAIALADEHLALVRSWNVSRDTGTALRTRAYVEPDSDRRLELLEGALAAFVDALAPVEAVETQAELGRALLRAGRRTEARDMLAEALDGATRCGARRLVGRITSDLRVAGGRPRRVLISGVDALTPAERQTADLAAHGLSNRDVAQDLFLSVRTVENTLRRVYRKLDINSRDQLAAALGAAEPADGP